MRSQANTRVPVLREKMADPRLRRKKGLLQDILPVDPSGESSIHPRTSPGFERIPGTRKKLPGKHGIRIGLKPLTKFGGNRLSDSTFPLGCRDGTFCGTDWKSLPIGAIGDTCPGRFVHFTGLHVLHGVKRSPPRTAATAKYSQIHRLISFLNHRFFFKSCGLLTPLAFDGLSAACGPAAFVLRVSPISSSTLQQVWCHETIHLPWASRSSTPSSPIESQKAKTHASAGSRPKPGVCWPPMWAPPPI